MQYFIGIVPPDNYKEKIVNFQKQVTQDPALEVVEPHITVKAQGGLTEDLKWVSQIKEVCATFPAFTLTLSVPKFFGSDILFLSTNSEYVVQLHNQLVNAVAPPKDIIEKYFEQDLYTAHLTLAQTSWGVNVEKLNTAKIQAEEELFPYPTFTVEYIRIYKEAKPGRYEAFMDIPLEG